MSNLFCGHDREALKWALRQKRRKPRQNRLQKTTSDGTLPHCSRSCCACQLSVMQ